MAEITINNCQINSVEDMSVVCSATNATTIDSLDGSIQIFVYGGTPPYTYTWVGSGQIGNYLGNLGPGEYTITVTDYYGDYTETVTCTVDYDSFYLDKFLKCSEDISSSNIYVFYDGTSLNVDSAKEASESIRTWFASKVEYGYTGLLYEGVIGKVSHNSENWLWWANYPYLGSLTGGTLSDGTTIEIFGKNGEYVENSSINPGYCSNTYGSGCIPKLSSFNFSTSSAGGSVGPIYQRINKGLDLNTGGNDPRSQGVPFTVTSQMDGQDTGIYGDFIGGDTDYICIIVADEADGIVGLYHGRTPGSSTYSEKTFLFTNPFELYGDGWVDETLKEPTNRYVHDYESFLKVWEDIKQQGGNFNGLIYPVINDSFARVPFVQHTVAAVEGETITDTEFQNKYGSSIQLVGPEELNLIELTNSNVYDSLTGTSAYIGLKNEYKNGPGLKHFGWQVNPNVTDFSESVVGDALDQFIELSEITDEFIYVLPISNINPNNIYDFYEVDGCYKIDEGESVLYDGQEYYTATIQNTYTEEDGGCIACTSTGVARPIPQPMLCLSSQEMQFTFTQSGVDDNNNFIWDNDEYGLTLSFNNNKWEITPWSNITQGIMIQNNFNILPLGTWVNAGNPTSSLVWSMTEGICTGLPLELNASITNETCQGNNDGVVSLSASNGTPPYYYRIVNFGNYPAFNNIGYFNNLPPDSYIAEVSAGTETNTVNFTIGEGELSSTHEFSLSYIPTVNNTSSNASTRFDYTLNISPPLPIGVSATFNLKLTHVKSYRNNGVVSFSSEFEILKNGNTPYTYTVGSTDITTQNTNCDVDTVIKTTEVYDETTETITINGGDTVNGHFTHNCSILSSSVIRCSNECRMEVKYTNSLTINNLNISSTNCGGAIVTSQINGVYSELYSCQNLT